MLGIRTRELTNGNLLVKEDVVNQCLECDLIPVMYADGPQESVSLKMNGLHFFNGCFEQVLEELLVWLPLG